MNLLLSWWKSRYAICPNPKVLTVHWWTTDIHFTAFHACWFGFNSHHTDHYLQAVTQKQTHHNLACATIGMASGNVQDTLKAAPASSAKRSDCARMKRSINMAMCVTSSFYFAAGCLGYSAFGDVAPTNLLIVQRVGSSRSGFTNPYWLVDCANVFVMVNMLGGYQVSKYTLLAHVGTGSALCNVSDMICDSCPGTLLL